MFQIVRVPPAFDKFFHPLKPRFHWDHDTYFRVLVLVMAFGWGRRNVANLSRYLEAQHHRTRCNNFFLNRTTRDWHREVLLGYKGRCHRPRYRGEPALPRHTGLDLAQAEHAQRLAALRRARDGSLLAPHILLWCAATRHPRRSPRCCSARAPACTARCGRIAPGRWGWNPMRRAG